MKKIGYILFLWLYVFGAYSQNREQDTINNSILKAVNIPDLDTLISYAIQNSYTLKSKSIEQQILENKIKVQKRKWSDYVFIEAATNYGLYDQLVVSGVASENAYNSGIMTRGEQLRYYGGMGVKLPLSTFMVNQKLVQNQRLEVYKAENEIELETNQLRSDITKEYFHLKYLQESLKTFIEIYNTLAISKIKAENDLMSGRLNFSDYALLVSTVGKAKDEYLKTQSEFYAQCYKLTILTNYPLIIKQ